MDRRIHRTRRALKDALQELLLEKGFDAVTVEEITDRADIGRATFYLHYRDKEDLLMESVSELAEGLVEQISQVPLLDDERGDPLTYLAVAVTFEHAAANQDLYRIILQSSARRGARRLREIMTTAVEQILESLAQRENLILQPQVPMEVFTNYLVGSWLGIMSWWLEEDLPYPPDEMAAMYQKMVILGGRELLGASRQQPNL